MSMDIAGSRLSGSNLQGAQGLVLQTDTQRGVLPKQEEVMFRNGGDRLFIPVAF